MASLIAWVLANPTVIAIVGGLVAALGWGVKQRRAGAKAERARQAEAEKRARDMADEVDREIAGLPADQMRERLKKWSK